MHLIPIIHPPELKAAKELGNIGLIICSVLHSSQVVKLILGLGHAQIVATVCIYFIFNGVYQGVDCFFAAAAAAVTIRCNFTCYCTK